MAYFPYIGTMGAQNANNVAILGGYIYAGFIAGDIIPSSIDAATLAARVAASTMQDGRFYRVTDTQELIQGTGVNTYKSVGQRITIANQSLTGATVVIAGLANYSEVEIQLSGASHNGAGSADLTIGVSDDGATFYNASIGWIGGGVAAATNINGYATLNSVSGMGMIKGFASVLGKPFASSSASTGFSFGLANPISHIQLAWTAAYSFDAGTLTVVGKR